MKYALLVIFISSGAYANPTTPTAEEVTKKYEQCLQPNSDHTILGIADNANKKTAKLAMKTIHTQYNHRNNEQLDPNKALIICRAATCAYYRHSQKVR